MVNISQLNNTLTSVDTTQELFPYRGLAVDYYSPGKLYFDSIRHDIRAVPIRVVGYYNPGKYYFDSSGHYVRVVPIMVVDYYSQGKNIF